MRKTFCKFISVAGAARQRIRNAARRNDDRVALDIPVACGDNKSISRLFHAFDNGIKPYFDAVFQKRVAQRFYDVGRFIAFRENPVSALDDKRQSVFFQKRHRILARKTVNRALHKFCVCNDVFQKLTRGAVVCDVASAFPRDIKFFAEFFVFLDKDHFIVF